MLDSLVVKDKPDIHGNHEIIPKVVSFNFMIFQISPDLSKHRGEGTQGLNKFNQEVDRRADGWPCNISIKKIFAQKYVQYRFSVM
jgi:hypothetical protein